MIINRLLQEKENYNNEISLLVSILIRYPQISSLNYDNEKDILRFSFLANHVYDSRWIDDFKQRIENSLEAFHGSNGMDDVHFELDCQSIHDVTRFELTRNVTSLSQEEISLLVMLFEDAFRDNLVMDRNDSLVDEDMQIQEEIIDSMLHDLQGGSKDRNFIAYREEGRLLVFNK